MQRRHIISTNGGIQGTKKRVHLSFLSRLRPLDILSTMKSYGPLDTSLKELNFWPKDQDFSIDLQDTVAFKLKVNRLWEEIQDFSLTLSDWGGGRIPPLLCFFANNSPAKNPRPLKLRNNKCLSLLHIITKFWAHSLFQSDVITTLSKHTVIIPMKYTKTYEK